MSQGDDDRPLPPVPAELGLNRPTRAGVEAFRELIVGIRHAASRGTPGEALSHAVAQVRLGPHPSAMCVRQRLKPLTCNHVRSASHGGSSPCAGLGEV